MLRSLSFDGDLTTAIQVSFTPAPPARPEAPTTSPVLTSSPGLAPLSSMPTLSPGLAPLSSMPTPSEIDLRMEYLKASVNAETDLEAAIQAGLSLTRGYGIQIDFQRAITILTPYEDDPRVMALLAACYLLGTQDVHDDARGKELLDSAREANDIAAYLVLGDCHALGKGVASRVNLEEASQHYNAVIAMQAREDEDLTLWKTIAKIALAKSTSDPQAALDILQDAAQAPVPAAWYAYGMQLIQSSQSSVEASDDKKELAADPELLQQRLSKGIGYVKDAARAKYLDACLTMARNYGLYKLKTYFIEEIDFKLAAKYYLYAAELGNTEFQDFMNWRRGRALKYWECSDDTDLHPILASLRARAEYKNSDVLVNLGLCYEYGLGVSPDNQKAVDMYNQAAARDHAMAQYRLGFCYHHGKGVTENLDEAKHWYTKAAEKGITLAYYGLGLCFVNADEEVESVQDTDWFHKGMSHDDPSCLFALACRARVGHGVDQDETQVIWMLQDAAKSGYEMAQTQLGVCYATGKGVAQDLSAAIAWYRKAAAQGDADAQYLLGKAYAEGEGVDPDSDQAFIWYTKAANQGNLEALEALQMLTPSDDHANADFVF